MASRGWSRLTKGTPNQALHLTRAACRLSPTHRLPRGPGTWAWSL